MEREICDHWEYDGNNVFSIYGDIINGIHRDKFIDLTEKNFQDMPPSIDKLSKDCSIMNRCVSVVNIGGGGGLVMALCCAKVVNFTSFQEWPKFSHVLAKNELEKGNFIFSNVGDFIKKINCL